MNSKYVIGCGPMLDWAVAAWREAAPELDVRVVALDMDKAYVFALDALDGLGGKDGATAFAAFDESFLNLRRFELMGELKARGFSMPALVCRGAIVASTAVIGENAAIGAGAIVGHGCEVGYNSVVGAGANLGGGSKIGASCWIEAGVLVGRDATIGANVTLGLGVIVGNGVEVGKQCIIDRPGKLSEKVAPKTFVHSHFDNPIVVVDY